LTSFFGALTCASYFFISPDEGARHANPPWPSKTQKTEEERRPQKEAMARQEVTPLLPRSKSRSGHLDLGAFLRT